MFIVHISAECYPAAKVGGLADVVGALPSYQQQLGHEAIVLIPKYGMEWIKDHTWTTVFEAEINENGQWIPYTIQQLEDGVLPFPLLVADIPQYFDRPGVYADPPGHYFQDDTNRYFAFQQAALIWLNAMDPLPDIIHCHDHQTGLIPFFMKFGIDYPSLAMIPSVYTIHNGNYQGWHSWQDVVLLPRFKREMAGFIDWQNMINSTSSGVRNAWKVTTVSPSYLEELKQLDGIGSLYRQEAHKTVGLLNGIDYEVWNPKKDTYLTHRMKRNIHSFKKLNKKAIVEGFELDGEAPLFIYIGRFAHEKGVHILPDVIGNFLSAGNQASFIILGSGDEALSHRFHHLSNYFPDKVQYRYGYDEPLAHMLYAAADFLIMPSLVEPCGLNQMYSMHYGTIPIVRAVGGLKDTVVDIEQMGGGLRFGELEVNEIIHTLYRAMHVYHNEGVFKDIRKRIIGYDFSWKSSAQKYIDLYEEISPQYLEINI